MSEWGEKVPVKYNRRGEKKEGARWAGKKVKKTPGKVKVKPYQKNNVMGKGGSS